MVRIGDFPQKHMQYAAFLASPLYILAQLHVHVAQCRRTQSAEQEKIRYPHGN